jgi:hypothetical protein
MIFWLLFVWVIEGKEILVYWLFCYLGHSKMETLRKRRCFVELWIFSLVFAATNNGILCFFTKKVKRRYWNLDLILFVCFMRKFNRRKLKFLNFMYCTGEDFLFWLDFEVQLLRNGSQ